MPYRLVDFSIGLLLIFLVLYLFVLFGFDDDTIQVSTVDDLGSFNCWKHIKLVLAFIYFVLEEETPLVLGSLVSSWFGCTVAYQWQNVLFALGVGIVVCLIRVPSLTLTHPPHVTLCWPCTNVNKRSTLHHYVFDSRTYLTAAFFSNRILRPWVWQSTPCHVQPFFQNQNKQQQFTFICLGMMDNSSLESLRGTAIQVLENSCIMTSDRHCEKVLVCYMTPSIDLRSCDFGIKAHPMRSFSSQVLIAICYAMYSKFILKSD